MMRTIAAAVLLTLGAIAGELRVEPARPQSGKPIEFSYVADSEYFSEPDSVWLCIYAFDDNRFYPTAWDVRLERKGTTYRGTFSAVPSDAVFLLFRIVSGREYDDNRGRYWDVLVWNGSTPKTGAYFRQAISYLGQGQVVSHQLHGALISIEPRNYSSARWKAIPNICRRSSHMQGYDSIGARLPEAISRRRFSGSCSSLGIRQTRCRCAAGAERCACLGAIATLLSSNTALQSVSRQATLLKKSSGHTAPQRKRRKSSAIAFVALQNGSLPRRVQ